MKNASVLFRQFVIVCCFFPATFFQYPFGRAWLRAFCKPRTFFKNVVVNAEEIQSEVRRHGRPWAVLVGIPLQVGMEIHFFSSVTKGIAWSWTLWCAQPRPRHSSQATRAGLLPPGPVPLLPGLLEKHPLAFRKADSLLEGLQEDDISIAECVQVVKGEDCFAGETVAVMAHWDPDAKIADYVVHMISHFRSLGWKVILSSAAPFSPNTPLPPADAIVYRHCAGYDFTSWKAALTSFPSLLDAKELILCNDSVFGAIGSYQDMHDAMAKVDCDFWGITESHELMPHLQSFHMVFRSSALRHPAFARFFGMVSCSNDREEAIAFEVRFSLWLARHGLKPAAFVPVAADAPAYHNPSWDCWRELLDAGVPLLKRELLFKNARGISLDGWAAALKSRQYPLDLIFQYAWRLGVDITPLLCDGLRTGSWPSDILALQERIELQEVNTDALDPNRHPLGIFLHIYYLHILPELANCLSNFERTAHVYVSTDTEEKATQIHEVLAPMGFSFIDVRVLPNKGWDIGPFLIGFAEEIKQYPLIVRLHTKCSAQMPQEVSSKWRNMIYSSLVGSKDRVRRLEALFAQRQDLGMICPPPVDWYATNVNMAGNLAPMRRLLAPYGIPLTAKMAIDFPMGSMFWCRSEALLPWLNSHFTFEQFDDTNPDNRDGSLAHAVERLFLFGCGISGLRWGRVAPVGFDTQVPRTTTTVSTRLQHSLGVLRSAPLLGRLLPDGRKVRDVNTPVKYTPSTDQPPLGFSTRIQSRDVRPELVLVLPRIFPRYFSGGPNTALLFAAEVARAGYNIHCLSESPPTCSTKVLRNHLRGLLSIEPGIAERFRVSCMSSAITLNANDRLLATAWWTTRTARTLASRMEKTRFIYFIQDFEPLFYAWSEEHAKALLSYDGDFLPIVNEPCLAEFCHMVQPGRFADAAFRNNTLSFVPAVDREHFFPEKRVGKRKLLFYARPSAPRNLYNFGLEAIYRLVQNKTLSPDEWQVLFLGEDTVPAIDFGRGVVSRTLPWLGFSAYAAHIRQASVGLSSMLSPHTSYMPLELAAAGVPVVTTAYLNKSAKFLQNLSPDIIGVDPTVEAITEGLRLAILRATHDDPHVDALQAPHTWQESFASIMPRVLQFMEKGQ